MRTLLCALLCLGAFIGTTATTLQDREIQEPFLYQRVLSGFEAETGAHNAVAAVLLNYRMYDTMFEALILLTAIIGMQQFLPRAVDIAASLPAGAGEEGEDG